MDVYDMAVKPVVDGAICGFTGTIFAYGNTGSGRCSWYGCLAMRRGKRLI